MLYLRCLLVLAGLATFVLGQTKSPDEAYNSTSSFKAAKAEEVYLFSINAWSFYKVSAKGQMTAENINRTCQAAGYVMPCPGFGICQNSACVATSLDDCLNPMLEVSTMICGTTPDKCPQLYGVYAYAANPWPGNSCGAEPGQWCTKGTDFYNKHAFCAKENDDRTEDGFILVADLGLQAIFQINLTTGSEVELPLGSMSAPVALNYDPANDDVYWTDITEKKIKRGSRNGDKVEILVEGNIVDGLALDLTAGNMFWTERETDVISVARLDGRHQKVLFSTDLYEPRAIVLDPTNGRMFWTDWGPGNQKIERASMDGTDRVTIVNTALGGPNGLTIDFNENRLYWCDCCTHTIESTDFLGRDRRLLVRYPPLHFFGVALDDGHIYATTWNVKRIVWTKRSAPLRYGLIGSTHKGLNGIIVHKTMQSPSLRSNITNACTVMNGGCQHLCLLHPGGRTCGCQQSWTLQDDGTTCQYKDNDDTMTTSTAWQLPVALSLAAIVLVAVCAVGSFVYWKKSRKRTKPGPAVNYDLTNVTFHPDILDPERSASPVVAPDATPHGEPDTAPNNSSDASPNSEVVNRPRFEEYELDRNILHLKREIGRGAFGIAFLAKMDGRPGDGKVVVKTVYEDATEEERVTFLREIKTTARLGKHVNLLGLVGCCTDGPSPLMVTEYMPYGDLKAFLLNCRQLRQRILDPIYNFKMLNVYQVARQVANGMIFISEARYVHGDLAARNVLVGNDLIVKIADFGLTTDIYQRGYTRQSEEQRIPVKWMAPERLFREGRYTSKSDVWSFGVVLFELGTLGNVPYPGIQANKLVYELREGYREPQPPGYPINLYKLMLSCWGWDEEDRPDFQQLYLALDTMIETESDVDYLVMEDGVSAEVDIAGEGPPNELTNATHG